MNLNPSHRSFYSYLGRDDLAEELQDISSSRSGVSLVLKFDRDKLASLSYPVICENWEKCVGPYASGSKRRKFIAEFTEAERKVLSKYNQRFYRWYLVTGPPAYFIFGKVSTIRLIQRAAAFFASI